MHQYQDLIRLFNQCFQQNYNTVLILGADEPLYVPADKPGDRDAIFFAHGFFSSALHECAHWLIAGPERRMQRDYGYWYIPDGRTTEEQYLFQKVEIKPQAIEWILSAAAGYRFQFSIDNLTGSAVDSAPFKAAVFEQACQYLNDGLPPRAHQFWRAICAFYGGPFVLDYPCK